MLVLGGALACFVALPLFFMSMAFVVDSVSPTVDTARWFTATAGCALMVVATVSLLPLAHSLATPLRRAVGPRHVTMVGLAALTLTLPAFVYGTTNDEPPPTVLFALGAIGLAVAATILLGLIPARSPASRSKRSPSEADY